VEIFELIKSQVNFINVVSSYGITFNSSGKTLCPFHEDKNPSFHNYGTHGYCFSCGRIADVIDLEANFNNLSRFEAALSLARKHGIGLPSVNEYDKKHYNKINKAQKLLIKFSIYANKKLKNPKYMPVIVLPI